MLNSQLGYVIENDGKCCKSSNSVQFRNVRFLTVAFRFFQWKVLRNYFLINKQHL